MIEKTNYIFWLWVIVIFCQISSGFMLVSCFDLSQTGDIIWSIGAAFAGVAVTFIVPFILSLIAYVKHKKNETF